MSTSGAGIRVRLLAEFLSSSSSTQTETEDGGVSASDRAWAPDKEARVTVTREVLGMSAPGEGRGDWGPNQIRVPGSVPGSVFRTSLGHPYAVYEGRLLVLGDIGPGTRWTGSCVFDSPDGRAPDRVDVYQSSSGDTDKLTWRLWFNTKADEMRVPPAFSAAGSVAVLVYVPIGPDGSAALPERSTCFRGAQGATVHGETGASRPWSVTRVDSASGSRVVAWALLSSDGQKNPDMELAHEIVRGAALDMAVVP